MPDPEKKEGEEDLIPKEDLPQDKPGDESGDKPADKPADTPLTDKPADAPVDKPAEEPVVPDPAPVPSQPKPVPGETPKEVALRLELVRLRTKLRGEGVEQIVEQVVIKPTDDDPYKILRDKGYTEEQIKDMEVSVDLIAKNKGYVHSGDSYKQSVQDSIDSFVDDHDEYKPANDTDDLRWTQFQSILQSGIYNLAGKTPRQLKSIFIKVDEDVKKELGEPVTIKLTSEQLAAQQHKINITNHSGGTQIPSTPAETVDLTKPIGGVQFKGFEADDFKKE